MPVYEIIPQTTISGYTIGKPVDGTNVVYCRRLCNADKACDGFVWEDSTSSCTLKLNTDTGRQALAGSTLYVKGGNSSYWWLWAAIAAFLVILFLYLCGRKDIPRR